MQTKKVMASEYLTARESYLSEFTTGYIECALWCGIVSEDNTSDSVEGDEADLSDAARADMEKDCLDFVDGNYSDLADLDPGQCGHDFYLTRNGHGAGFWDRGLGALGDRLSEVSRPYGTQNLYYGDDGKIYTSS